MSATIATTKPKKGRSSRNEVAGRSTGGAGGAVRRYIGNRSMSFTMTMAQMLWQIVAAIVVEKIDAGSVEPTEARSAIIPLGSTATPAVLIARKRHIAFVAVSFVWLS